MGRRLLLKKVVKKDKGDISDVVQSLVSYIESQVRKGLIPYVKGIGLNL